LRISNRKILQGLIDSWGKNDFIEVVRIVDKLEKTGVDNVKRQLHTQNYNTDQINDILSLISIKAFSGDELVLKLEKIGRFSELLEGKDFFEAASNEKNSFFIGVLELHDVLTRLIDLPSNSYIADLSIVRGLDYYTGTVYETQLLDVPEFTGSVCSGGRYDDLAGSYINKHLPGVGISIGLSRLFDVIKQKRPDLLGLNDKSPKGPAHILMTVPENESDRPLAYDAARTLRKRGFNVEMYHAPKKIGDQMKYAAKKNLPFVWFVRDGAHEVKDMIAQTQSPADPKTWSV
jgi:histidyl-tRNA synthetase